jgi:hypothetical protein
LPPSTNGAFVFNPQRCQRRFGLLELGNNRRKTLFRFSGLVERSPSGGNSSFSRASSARAVLGGELLTTVSATGIHAPFGTDFARMPKIGFGATMLSLRCPR